MSKEKKKQQLDAVKAFGQALHDLRCAGIRQEYQQDGTADRIILIDRESDEQVAEFAAAEFLIGITGQTIDEFAISTDYFGDLVKDDPQIETTE